jgi:molybdopterin synthase catalytic subunit
MIEITRKPIDTDAILRSVQDERCGASVLFLGTTRAVTDGQRTQSLEYECYEAMATSMLKDLTEQAQRRWPIVHCSIVHRIGAVEIGAASIAIAVSSPHRASAFAAGQWLIDTIKASVPIWKKELWADGRQSWQHPGSFETRAQRATGT